MKRPRRWLRKLVASLLLLVCAAMMVAWPLSYWIDQGLIIVYSQTTMIAIADYPGSLVIGLDRLHGNTTFGTSPRIMWTSWNASQSQYQSVHTWLNFRFHISDGIVMAGVPLWLGGILCGYLGVRMLRKAKEIPKGFCAICGYDLRATPDRCPECGTVPAQHGAAPPAV